MSHFDDLLDEVLQQEANPEPPAHMKDRLLNAFAVGGERSGRRFRFGMGFAAAVLAGFTTWALWRITPRATVSVPGNISRVDINRAMGQPEADANPAAQPAVAVLRRTVRARSSRARSGVTIQPLEIDSISIPPIEIPDLKIPKQSQKRRMQ